MQAVGGVMAVGSSGGRLWKHCVAGFLTVSLVIGLLAGPLWLQGMVPGDLGDSRYNLYILEHGYRWLSGRDPSFISPSSFYPYPGTLFWSDTHVGTAIVYSAFRALGVSQYSAFFLWFFVGYITTYVAAHFALARMGAGAFEASMGAAIFAFGLPSLGLIFAHAQLVYRGGVPLAILYLSTALRDGSAKALLLAICWVCAQTAASIYIGYFLFLLMAGFSVAFLALKGSLKEIFANVRALGSDLFAFLRSPGARGTCLIILTAGLLLGVGALLWGHSEAARIYGFTRPWQEISAFLPRPSSYLLMDYLPYWERLGHNLPASLRPDFRGIEWARTEHEMFVGLGVALLFLSGLATLALRPSAAGGLPDKPLLIAAAFLVFATLSINGHTAYRLFVLVPGINSIRAIGRIITMLLFPVSVIAVVGMRGLSVLFGGHAVGKVVVAACMALMLFDISQLPLTSFAYAPAESQRRVDAIIADANARRGSIEAPILAYHGNDIVLTELDAMLAAQQLGWPTLNGYSGNLPPGSSGTTNCVWMTRRLGYFDIWQAAHGSAAGPMFPEFSRRLVYAGWPDCRPKRQPSFSVGSPPSANVPGAVELRPGSVERRDDQLAFTVDIHNGSNELIPAISSAPILILWRFVDATRPGDPPSFQLTEYVGVDIPPNSDAEVPVITAKLPQQPGLYELQVTLAAAGSFLFHDRGMRILTFPQRFAVTGGGRGRQGDGS